MYSGSRYLVSRLPHRSEINGIGGFPHSEICGSKVAHTSPQLIAACHVLHRLYAPRHPRIALTSRLRVHTTNDNAGPAEPPGGTLHACRRSARPINSAEQRRRSILVWMFNLSQIWPLLIVAAVTTTKRPVKRTGPALADTPCSMPLVRTDTFTASILRTHSQCQRWMAGAIRNRCR